MSFVTLGEMLANLARNSGVSTKMLAAKTGLGQETVSACLTGTGTYESAARIAKAMGRKVRAIHYTSRKRRAVALLAEATKLDERTCTRALFAIGSLQGGGAVSQYPGSADLGMDLGDLQNIYTASLDAILKALDGKWILY